MGLSNAIDTVSQRTGTTTLKMVTYMHANGSEESVTFRIHRETLKKDNTKVDEKAEDLYEMTEGQFNQLHSGCSDADCGHWWHNLDELWKRSNDRACLEVQDYAVSQELVLSPTAWKQNPKQKPLWDRFEQGLSRYDTSILDQSHILKKDRQIIKIHRDAMTPGVGRLLRAARDVSAEPRRLNPANTQEASVMAEVLEKTIFHSHMWPKEPAEYRDWLRDEVMEALGDTAVPRVDVVRGAHVHVAPGFSEFLDKFVTRLINWYMDPGRSCGRVFKDPKLPPPGKRKAVEEEETEEEGAKRLRKSRRLKGEEVLDY